MKRKLKWLIIVLAVSLLGFGTALLLWPRDRITAASWEKIRIGMTEKEVENILGSSGLSLDEFVAKPFIPNKVSLLEPGYYALQAILVIGQDEGGDKYWLGRRGMILIVFDQEGHVGGKSFQGRRSGFWHGLRDWLDW
jgi:hypothetical protein